MRTFPSLPETQFDWFSVAWEPIALSGERLVAFLVIYESGNTTVCRIHKCVSDRQIHCLFGHDVEKISALFEFVKSLLSSQGSALNCFDSDFGIPGFSIGRKGFVFANSQTEALRIATREGSLFGSTALAEFTDSVFQVASFEETQVGPLLGDRFFQMVQQLVVQKSPQLSGKFQQSFKLTENARGTKIDFAGDKLFANLHRLKPGKSLTQQIKYGKQKLLDLSSLRLWLSDQKIAAAGAHHQDFELLTHRPVTESIDYSLPQIRQVNEAVEELTYIADHHELRLRLFTNEETAAGRIIEAEVVT